MKPLKAYLALIFILPLQAWGFKAHKMINGQALGRFLLKPKFGFETKKSTFESDRSILTKTEQSQKDRITI